MDWRDALAELETPIFERKIMANQTLTGAKTESIASRLERAGKSLSEVESLASEIHYELIGAHLPPEVRPGPEEVGTLSRISDIADRLESVRRGLADIKGFIAE
jgi:hypothetical protein